MSDAESYLNNIRELNVLLKMKELERERLEADICSLSAIDYSKSKISGGQSADLSNKIARLDELIRDVDAEWDKLIDRREEAKTILQAMTDEKQRQLLLLYYVRYASIDEVAAAMCLSRPQVFREKERAVRAFEPCYVKYRKEKAEKLRLNDSQ